jgi:hypothetical protein
MVAVVDVVRRGRGGGGGRGGEEVKRWQAAGFKVDEAEDGRSDADDVSAEGRCNVL